MKALIKDLLTVFVVLDKDAAKELSSEVERFFVLRGAMDEALIVEVPIRRVGDLATMKGVVEVYEDEIPQEMLEALSPEAARLATIWNWRLQSKRSAQPMTDDDVSKVMEQLDLEIIKNQVVDRHTGKSLGEVEESELESQHRLYSPNSPQCFWLRQSNDWRGVPGFFGCWVRARGTSEARQCTSTGGMSSNRQVVDYIRVTVWNQVGCYARRSRSDSSFVDAEDWEYVWLWEVEAGGGRASSDHYARLGDHRISCSP